MMQLSNNFKLPELLVSQTATRHGIDMTPPDDVLFNLQRLAWYVLEPVRYAVQNPIIISSGYRPALLNKKIGGAKNSQHLHGLAADISAVNVSVPALFSEIRRSVPAVDQCILEFNRWVHVSVWDEAFAPRNEFLIATRNDDGTTRYTRWE